MLIFDCTYNIYLSGLPLLCFDFIIRLRVILPLVYILILDKTFDRYEQAFKTLQRLFEEYEIDEPNIIIYDRDRAAINALEAVFPGVQSILCTQYIDTAVEIQAYKTFGQQKSEDSIRYVASKVAAKFIALYKTCRNTAIEDRFDEAYNVLLKRAQRDEALDNSANSADSADSADSVDDEVDKIARPIELSKHVLDNNKDTPERQLKIVRYLEKYQQVYKEKCVKAQTNRLHYYGYNISSASKGAYAGLKRQTQSARNNTLTFFIKLGPFYNSYIDRYNTALLVVQNNLSTQFVNKAFYYSVNTMISIRVLRYIYKQKAKLDAELEYIRNDRYYVRSVYTSVFTIIIGIDCSYKLDSIEVVTPRSYDTFQYILGTLADNSELVVRVLEAAVRFRKRLVR